MNWFIDVFEIIYKFKNEIMEDAAKYRQYLFMFGKEVTEKIFGVRTIDIFNFDDNMLNDTIKCIADRINKLIGDKKLIPVEYYL